MMKNVTNMNQRPSRAALSSVVMQSAVKFSGTRALALAAGTIAGLLIPRSLGPETYGIWASAAIVLAYLPFLPLGLDHAAAREIPLLRGRGLAREVEEVRSSYFTVALAVAMGTSLILAIMTFLIPFDPRLAWSLRVVAMVGLVAALGRWAVILLKAENRFGAAGTAEALPLVGQLLAVPVVYAVGLPGLWLGYLVGSLSMACTAYAAGHFRPRLSWNPALLRRLVRFGTPIMFMSLLQALSISGDKLIVLGSLGTSAVGIYSIGRICSQALLSSGGVIGPVLYPRMSELYGQTGNAVSLRKLTALPPIVIGAIAPAIVILSWFGLPVVFEVLLPQFRNGLVAAQILFSGMGIYLIFSPAVFLVLAIGRQGICLVYLASGVATSLLLEYAAIAFGLGLAGVAFGAVIGSLIYVFSVYLTALHHCGLEPGERIINLVWLVFPSAVAVVIALAFSRLWPSPIDWQGNVVPMVVRALTLSTLSTLACVPLSGLLVNRLWPGGLKGFVFQFRSVLLNETGNDIGQPFGR